MQSRSAGLDGRLPRPAAVGLDTLAILKVGTAATGATLDEREKEYETNPISHNPQGINGLQLVSSTAGRPAQQDLTDRSTWIRGDLDLSPIAQASAGRFAETCGPVGLDTLAILKGGGQQRDRRPRSTIEEKRNEPNFAQSTRNQWIMAVLP